MNMIRDKEIIIDGEETLLVFYFHSKETSFDYLRWSEEDDDYVLYLKQFDEIKKIYNINRFWIKTEFSELRNKKILFNDMQNDNLILRLWFYF